MFKVGDKVRVTPKHIEVSKKMNVEPEPDLVGQEGVVVRVNECALYPIWVSFPDRGGTGSKYDLQGEELERVSQRPRYQSLLRTLPCFLST